MKQKIHTANELLAAINNPASRVLELQTSLLLPFSLTLPPGVHLRGVDQQKCVLSFNNGDGIGLTADNEIANLTVLAPHSHRAIFALSDRADLGTLKLKNLTVTGQIQILTRVGTKKAKLFADQIDVIACDARKYSEQPQKYGVNVYQGAFTVYNFNGDSESLIEATLTNISIGRKGAPVFGSGLYISGFGDTGGRVEVDQLTTGEVHATGMIPYGTADIITGGVFVVYGAHVKKAVHHGSVVTYGVNDMVLDAWGKVDHWIAEKPLLSYGPSGIGFVNFGVVENFEAQDKIETFGLGARGFNQYDGTIGKAKFASITTYGDGSIGMQVSKPVGSIEITGSVKTHGSVGATLVKGVIMNLPANAISVKPGGEIRELIVAGDVHTLGRDVTSLEIEGKILTLSVKKEILADHGVAIRVAKGCELPNPDRLTAKGAKGNIVKE
ncbi:MAG: hypothetical protein JSU04_12735 [Bdellovibrionales bacterium]|nr:hypothetical protein [Bdellovibrionales bacterium]